MLQGRFKSSLGCIPEPISKHLIKNGKKVRRRRQADLTSRWRSSTGLPYSELNPKLEDLLAFKATETGEDYTM